MTTTTIPITVMTVMYVIILNHDNEHHEHHRVTHHNTIMTNRHNHLQTRELLCV